MNFLDFESIIESGKKYKVIYADPPWDYNDKKTGGSFSSGASQQYLTMSLDKIKKLPIHDITNKDCALFLWATVPLNPEAHIVLNAWGFTYKTKLIWNKQRIGLGHWFRVMNEELFVGIKGDVKAFNSQLPNLISRPIQKHSKKPHRFREIIEGVTVGLEPKIELFARTRIYGWDTLGNEPELNQPTLDEVNLDSFTGVTI